MIAKKPPMGWNSWNTFGNRIDEQLFMQIADVMEKEGYKDAGYEYLIIDDCWALRERADGKLAADPKLFPHGIKYLSDYVHSKGLKFGMYSCAGFLTCAGYPGSYGHEFEDAKQFAEWGVDYLKYDFCNFPSCGNGKNAYLTMAMALRSTGRDIVFAACNWGMEDPAKWMRSHGAHTYRSTGDIADVPQSYIDIFKGQRNNLECNAPGCFNDLDMLIVGMHGNGNVAVGGCSNEQYLQHFAMWAFFGSPLIIGGDLRNMDDENKAALLNRGLIGINQDEEARAPFCIFEREQMYIFVRLLSGGKFAVAIFSLDGLSEQMPDAAVSFEDLGIHSETNISVKLTDAVTGEPFGTFRDGFSVKVKENEFRIFIGEIVL